MTRSERKKLKRKIKQQLWVATGCVIFFITLLILAFTIDWRPTFLTELIDNDDPASAFEVLVVFIIIGLFIMPLAVGLVYNSKSAWAIRKLLNERKRLYSMQLRMYVERFCSAIVQGDEEKAIDIHNNLIWGDVKSLTRGILIGYFLKSENPNDTRTALKNLNNLPDEVYNEKIE